jgi:hypothetical protein
MEITGKIQWLPDAPNEYPKDSGKFNIGIKVKDEFYNLYDTKEKLEKMLTRIKMGYEVKLQVEGNKIEGLEVLSDKVEEKSEPQPDSDMIKIQGKDYMTYPGLLRKAHEKEGTFSMEITESFVSEDMKMAWCKVRLTAEQSGELTQTFDGFGSSTPDNTKAMTQFHPVEMAHTRAKGRALRDFLNIGEVMAEEMK